MLNLLVLIITYIVLSSLNSLVFMFIHLFVKQNLWIGVSSVLQWSPRDSLPAPISSAIYSCDGLLVYAGFCDGAVGVFDAESLRLRCRISPAAYLTSSIARLVSDFDL